MLDIHTHILPGIDDGSTSPYQSIEMLKMLRDQGVDRVVLSSHFYAEEETPERFLERRNRAFEILKNAIADEEKIKGDLHLPKLILGAEVNYFIGVSTSKYLRSLKIEGTPLLLLEMPKTRWDQGMKNEVMRMALGNEVIPLLAHIDRYLEYNKFKTFLEFRGAGALMQFNADYIAQKKSRRKVRKFAENGMLNFIGTDAHDTQHRKPDLQSALEMLGRYDQMRAFDSLDIYEEEFFS